MDAIHPELINLYAEIKLNVRKMIYDYQAEGLVVSISADIWGENGEFGSVLLLLEFCCSLYVYDSCHRKSYFGFGCESNR